MIDNVRYRPIVGGRLTVWVVFTLLLSVLVLFGIAAITAGSRGSLVFLAACVAAFAWNVRLFAFQMAFELQLNDTHLDAVGLTRSWHLPLEELRRIRWSRRLRGSIVIDSAMARPIAVFAARGLSEFIYGISDQRPDLPVDIDAVLSWEDNAWGYWHTEHD